MTDRPLICGFMKVRNEVIREGNIYRALDNLNKFCDVIVACDDASNDETGRILRAHPKVVVCLDVPREEQDFRNELAVKQAMLQEVHKIQPYFVWWHDADEELDAAGVEHIRELCEATKHGGPLAWRFVYRQLWRSKEWIRTDSGFGEGAFIKLWRWTPDLAFDVAYGTHRHQFPRQIAEVLHQVPTVPWTVIHWGNYGKNLEWKCIQYHGGLGGVERHLNFEHGEYEPLHDAPVTELKPVPFTPEEKVHILSMLGLRRTAGWFTVLVPTYNRMAGNKLLLALQSLLDQTYPHWIALVLDDGSTDDTPKRIQAWTEKDPRIFYCRYEQNRGGVAMNEIGTNLAIEFTEYWTRLGSDDYFDPSKLELDAWAFAQGAEAVYGPYQVLRHGGRAETCNPPLRPSVTQAALFNGMFAASWANVAVRCAALERVRQVWGRFADPRLRNMEDFLVNARVGQMTDGFHFRGIVDGSRAYVRSDADADAFGEPRAFLLSHRAKADAVWNVAVDGASSNMGVTARDDAMTRVILQEDRERLTALPPPQPPAPVPTAPAIRRVSIGAQTPPSTGMGITPSAKVKAFWRCASGFPKDKEAAYPGHMEAHGFDHHVDADVLEYGCGGGADTLSWLRRQCRVVATDIVPENVVITQQAIAGAGYTQGHANLLLQTTPLPFADGRFDVVSSHGVVHHIPAPGCTYLLQEFYRVLRPGGMFYLMLYTEHLWRYHWPDMQVHVQTKGLSQQEAFGWCTDGQGCPYARAYTEEQGRLFVETVGFHLEGVVDYNTKFFRTFQARRP